MDPELYNASRSGNIKTLEQVLKKNAEALKQVTPQKNTALHLAARAGKAEFVKRLCSSERELVTAKNASGNTALHEAAQIGALEVVQILMRHNINNKNLLEVRNELNETALFKACQGDQDHHDDRVKIVQEILASDPSTLWLTAADGRTCLHVAAVEGHKGIVDALLPRQRDQAIKLAVIEDDNGNTAMHLAVWGDHLGVVKKLLKLEPQLCYSLNKDHESPLHIAVKLGFLEIVQEIIKCKPDSIEVLTKDGKNVLHLATEIPQMEVMTYLVKNVDVSQLIDQHDNYTEQNPQGNCRKDEEEIESEPNDIHQITNGVRKEETHRCILLQGTKMPRSKPFLYCTRNVTDPKHKNCNKLVENAFKQRANSELVVAVLLATVSFTAAFTVPGGFYTDDDQKHGTPAGTPILIHRLSFKIFIVFDTVAFFLSLFVVLIFIAHSFTAAVYVVVVRKVKTLALILLSVGIFTSVCGHVVFLYVATKFMVKRARIQHLLGAQRIEDRLVNFLWTLAEKYGGLDILRSFEDKVHRILWGHCSSEQGLPVDQSHTSSEALSVKTTTELQDKVATPTYPQQLNLYEKKVSKAKRILLNSMKDHLIPHIVGKSTKEMNEALMTPYESVNISRKMLLKNKLTKVHMSDSYTMASYLMKMIKIIDHLSAIGMEMRSEELVPIALSGNNVRNSVNQRQEAQYLALTGKVKKGGKKRGLVKGKKEDTSPSNYGAKDLSHVTC
eukprot:Gb_26468 [translate_table: standard]